MAEEGIVKAFVKELLSEFSSRKYPGNSLSGLLLVFIIFLMFLGFLAKVMPTSPSAVYGVIGIGIISLVALLVVILICFNQSETIAASE